MEARRGACEDYAVNRKGWCERLGSSGVEVEDGGYEALDGQGDFFGGSVVGGADPFAGGSVDGPGGGGGEQFGGGGRGG